MNFRLGQKISGYLTSGLPFTGYIIGFIPQKTNDNPLARVKFYNNDDSGIAKLDTCHPLEVKKIKHSKESFLAAASRQSPHLYFKNPKFQRDFLENLWQELCDFTEK